MNDDFPGIIDGIIVSSYGTRNSSSAGPKSRTIDGGFFDPDDYGTDGGLTAAGRVCRQKKRALAGANQNYPCGKSQLI